MKFLLPFLFLIFPAVLVAQISTTLDNNPTSLKWKQINTPHFRILFPEGFQEQAQRMANTMEHIRSEESNTLGKIEPRRISIILQNQSSISNGFVSMMPRRSEFYAMPTQNYNFGGTNDWLDLLASHEYRHIVQYQHATRGFNKFLYYVFGSTTMAGMAQAAAPEWFWEGDAVVTETAFTPGGRGKIPNFSLLFRTNFLEGREFNYHKQYLGSYKHNIPNEYVLGYYMISHLRKRTKDPEIWSKITARSWNVPFIPFAFSNAIKKESGDYVNGLYRDMVRDLKTTWKQQVDTLSLTPYTTVNKRNAKAYTDYEFPQLLDDGSVLVLKRGIGDIETFVKIKDGKERKVFTPGYVNDAGMLSVSDDVIVWNEFGFDPRWAVQNFSLVKSYDLKTKKLKVIGSKEGRFGSASISPDGKQVVTVRTDVAYKTQVVILDVASGVELKTIDNPANLFFSMPRWSSDGKTVVVIKATADGKTISRIDVASSEVEDLLPFTTDNIGHPVEAGGYILFNSPTNGIDNILALHLATKEIYKVTNSRYGAYNPTLSKDGKTLFYNDQTRNGLDVVTAAFTPALWKSYTPSTTNAYDFLVQQEGHGELFKTVPQQIFPVTKYSKLKGIFNPYAWGFNVDTDLTTAQFGISSKDLLSTTAIDLGYVFDLAERTGSYQASLSYQGFYPILDIRGSYADRKVNEGDWYFNAIQNSGTPEADTVVDVRNLTFTWKEITVEGGIRLPLNLTHSRFNSRLDLQNYVGHTTVNNFENSVDDGGRVIRYLIRQEGRTPYVFRDYIDNGQLIYNQFGLTFYRLMKQSHRDINSRWGQSLFVNWYSTPYGGDFSGNQFSAYAILYFPGLVKHHSLWGYAAFQNTSIDYVSNAENNNYLFRNRIPMPRGLSVFREHRFYTLAGNYTLPLWYPDIAIGPLLNIQRFRGNVFMDYGYGQRTDVESVRTYASTGFELKADINIMRFKPQFDIGFRFSKGLQPSTTLFEVLIGTFNF